MKYDSLRPSVKYETTPWKHFFFTECKNEWKEHIFDNEKIKTSKFYKNKKLFKIDDVEVDKILISKKEADGKKSLFKYFIGYDDDDIRPLCIKLSQMIGFVKKVDDKKTMPFKVTDRKLLKKYTKIWKKVGSLMNKDFHSELFMVIMINT